MDADTPWGDGERVRKSLLKKDFILLLLVTISETSWSLYRMKPRSYNLPNFFNFSERGDPWGDLNAHEATFEKHLLFFSVTDAKNQQAC